MASSGVASTGTADLSALEQALQDLGTGLDQRISALEQAPPLPFSALSGVKTPGPTPPAVGGMYCYDPVGNLRLIPRDIYLNDPAFTTWAGTTPDDNALAITTRAIPSGTQGSAFPSTPIAVAHGLGPYTFALAPTSDPLPAGMTFDSVTGILSGTPSVSGTSNLIVRVTDALLMSVDQAYTLVVAATASPFAFSPPASLPDVTNGTALTAYDFSRFVTNPTGGVTFGVVFSPAAHGLALSAPGMLTGTPNAVGLVTMTITATDSGAHVASATVTINVRAGTGPTITSTTAPSGTKNSAYGPALLLMADSDPGAFAGAGAAWALAPSSPALPAGMTLTASTLFGTTDTGNCAILAGTPTVATTVNIIVRCTDANGVFDDQQIHLVIADVAAPFAFTPTTPMDGATQGTDYTHDFSTDCTNPGGTLSFDSYSNTPVTAVAMNNAGDTLTWSGQRASIPNGTVIALNGSAGTHGAVNGPATTYYVVSSGTRTVQLATTPGGTAIVFTGDEAGLTIQFPSLPSHGCHLDPTTGILTAAGGALVPGTINFWIRAYNGTTHLPVQVQLVIAASGATIDISTIGLVTGDLSSLDRPHQISTANANRTALNTAAETMRTHSGGQGSLTSTLARGTQIMLYNPTQASTMVTSGSSGNPGLNQWLLNGAELKLLDHQPLFPENSGGQGGQWHQGTVFGLYYAANPVLDFTCNGNAANQYGIDLTRNGAVQSRAGYSCHGASLWYCGPITFGNGDANPFIVKNCRAVTGASSNLTTLPGGTTVWTSECFHIENHRNVGNDTGAIHVFTDDGSYDVSGFVTAASGYKSHYQVGDAGGYHANNCLIQAGIWATPGSGTRHGIGTFRGGLGNVRAGSYTVYCHHGVNVEEGSGSNCDITEKWVFGDGSSYTSFQTAHCDIGISLDGSGDGFGRIEINGWTSTSDTIALNEVNATPRDGIYLNGVRVTGAHTVTNLNAGGASKTHLTDCKYHGTPIVNAGTAAAAGSWGTY